MFKQIVLVVLVRTMLSRILAFVQIFAVDSLVRAPRVHSQILLQSIAHHRLLQRLLVLDDYFFHSPVLIDVSVGRAVDLLFVLNVLVGELKVPWPILS